MWCLGKDANVLEPDEARNVSLNKFIGKERLIGKEKEKILLLGAGESGKSTILKQFRILNGSPMSDCDLRMYGVVVRSNIITAVIKLCELTRNLNYEQCLIEESKLETVSALQGGCGMTVKDAYDQIMAHLIDYNATQPLPEISDWVGTSGRVGSQANIYAIRCLELADEIEVLWQSPTIQKVWTLRATNNINDSHGAFINDIRRITSISYIPTEADVLKARLRTTHIILNHFTIKGREYEICDVGGQRLARAKWLDCFSDVDGVIFVAALSEYDQKLAEAKCQNRMVEALQLFGSVVKNAHFVNTPIMLFLNKKDIFAEKIKYSNIADVPHFSDYAGPPNDFDSGVLYFIQKFEMQLEGLPNDDFTHTYIHVTNATDTTNMEFVLNISRQMIMEENYKKAMINDV